jgi:uncharacterized protein YcfJ
MNVKKLQAAVLAMALMAPASSAFAVTHHRYHKHHNRTAGTAVGAVAGAVIDHRHPLTGALIGGALGNAVQYERSKH